MALGSEMTADEAAAAFLTKFNYINEERPRRDLYTQGSSSRSTALFSLLQTGELSDFVIVCGEYEFKVHRFVLRQYTYFEMACDGPFKEAREGRLHLPGEDLNAVKQVITFMYSRGERLPSESATELAALFSLACRFDMEDLKDLAFHEFQDIVIRDYNTGARSEDLVALVQIIYETIPVEESRGLRSVLAGYVAWRTNYLMRANREVLEQAFIGSGAFAFDVLCAEKGWELS